MYKILRGLVELKGRPCKTIFVATATSGDSFLSKDNLETAKDPWAEDRLGFKELGETFAALVKTIDDSKVLSIEAPFGKGKTFFRTAWSKQLRSEGEVVVEIDAQQSDHSGDPIVTFVGALINALGPTEQTRLDKVKSAGLKYGGIASRTMAKAIMGRAADELIEAVEGKLVDQDSSEILKASLEAFGEGTSRFAEQMIAAQMTAEKARLQELPEQIDALKSALTDGAETNRVVIIIDELDRCHPDYAIALLEAMKLIFNRDGFVFVLMVNRDHLESVAAHRFGSSPDGEHYLEKYVDMRLKLEASDEALAEAARFIASELPLETPLGEGEEFSVERAAQVAADFARSGALSMRQIEKILLNVELALRCYSQTKVDTAMLVYLAFIGQVKSPISVILPRAALTPLVGAKWDGSPINSTRDEQSVRGEKDGWVDKHCQELKDLPPDRYRMPPPPKGKTWVASHQVLAGLAPWYIPEHQAMLDKAHALLVPDEEVLEDPSATTA